MLMKSLLFLLCIYSSQHKLLCITNVEMSDLENHALYKICHDLVQPRIDKVAKKELELIENYMLRNENMRFSEDIFKDFVLRVLFSIKLHISRSFTIVAEILNSKMVFLAKTIAENTNRGRKGDFVCNSHEIKRYHEIIKYISEFKDFQTVLGLTISYEIFTIFSREHKLTGFLFYANYRTANKDESGNPDYIPEGIVPCIVQELDMFEYRLDRGYQSFIEEVSDVESGNVMAFFIFDFQKFVMGQFHALYLKRDLSENFDKVVFDCIEETSFLCEKRLRNSLKEHKYSSMFLDLCQQRGLKYYSNFQDCIFLWNWSFKKTLSIILPEICPLTEYFEFVRSHLWNVSVKLGNIFREINTNSYQQHINSKSDLSKKILVHTQKRTENRSDSIYRFQEQICSSLDEFWGAKQPQKPENTETLSPPKNQEDSNSDELKEVDSGEDIFHDTLPWFCESGEVFVDDEGPPVYTKNDIILKNLTEIDKGIESAGLLPFSETLKNVNKTQINPKSKFIDQKNISTKSGCVSNVTHKDEVTEQEQNGVFYHLTHVSKGAQCSGNEIYFQDSNYLYPDVSKITGHDSIDPPDLSDTENENSTGYFIDVSEEQKHSINTGSIPEYSKETPIFHEQLTVKSIETDLLSIRIRKDSLKETLSNSQNHGLIVTKQPKNQSDLQMNSSELTTECIDEKVSKSQSDLQISNSDPTTECIDEKVSKNQSDLQMNKSKLTTECIDEKVSKNQSDLQISNSEPTTECIDEKVPKNQSDLQINNSKLTTECIDEKVPKNQSDLQIINSEVITECIDRKVPKNQSDLQISNSEVITEYINEKVSVNQSDDIKNLKLCSPNVLLSQLPVINMKNIQTTSACSYCELENNPSNKSSKNKEINKRMDIYLKISKKFAHETAKNSFDFMKDASYANEEIAKILDSEITNLHQVLKSLNQITLECIKMKQKINSKDNYGFVFQQEELEIIEKMNKQIIDIMAANLVTIKSYNQELEVVEEMKKKNQCLRSFEREINVLLDKKVKKSTKQKKCANLIEKINKTVNSTAEKIDLKAKLYGRDKKKSYKEVSKKPDNIEEKKDVLDPLSSGSNADENIGLKIQFLTRKCQCGKCDMENNTPRFLDPSDKFTTDTLFKLKNIVDSFQELENNASEDQNHSNLSTSRKPLQKMETGSADGLENNLGDTYDIIENSPYEEPTSQILFGLPGENSIFYDELKNIRTKIIQNPIQKNKEALQTYRNDTKNCSDPQTIINDPTSSIRNTITTNISTIFSDSKDEKPSNILISSKSEKPKKSNTEDLLEEDSTSDYSSLSETLKSKLSNMPQNADCQECKNLGFNCRLKDVLLLIKCECDDENCRIYRGDKEDPNKKTSFSENYNHYNKNENNFPKNFETSAQLVDLVAENCEDSRNVQFCGDRNNKILCECHSLKKTFEEDEKPDQITDQKLNSKEVMVSVADKLDQSMISKTFFSEKNTGQVTDSVILQNFQDFFLEEIKITNKNKDSQTSSYTLLDSQNSLHIKAAQELLLEILGGFYELLKEKINNWKHHLDLEQDPDSQIDTFIQDTQLSILNETTIDFYKTSCNYIQNYIFNNTLSFEENINRGVKYFKKCFIDCFIAKTVFFVNNLQVNNPNPLVDNLGDLVNNFDFESIFSIKNNSNSDLNEKENQSWERFLNSNSAKNLCDSIQNEEMKKPVENENKDQNLQNEKDTVKNNQIHSQHIKINQKSFPKDSKKNNQTNSQDSKISEKNFTEDSVKNNQTNSPGLKISEKGLTEVIVKNNQTNSQDFKISEKNFTEDSEKNNQTNSPGLKISEKGFTEVIVKNNQTNSPGLKKDANPNEIINSGMSCEEEMNDNKKLAISKIYKKDFTVNHDLDLYSKNKVNNISQNKSSLHDYELRQKICDLKEKKSALCSKTEFINSLSNHLDTVLERILINTEDIEKLNGRRNTNMENFKITEDLMKNKNEGSENIKNMTKRQRKRLRSKKNYSENQVKNDKESISETENLETCSNNIDALKLQNPKKTIEKSIDNQLVPIIHKNYEESMETSIKLTKKQRKKYKKLKDKQNKEINNSEAVKNSVSDAIIKLNQVTQTKENISSLSSCEMNTSEKIIHKEGTNKQNILEGVESISEIPISMESDAFENKTVNQSSKHDRDLERLENEIEQNSNIKFSNECEIISLENEMVSEIIGAKDLTTCRKKPSIKNKKKKFKSTKIIPDLTCKPLKYQEDNNISQNTKRNVMSHICLLKEATIDKKNVDQEDQDDIISCLKSLFESDNELFYSANTSFECESYKEFIEDININEKVITSEKITTQNSNTKSFESNEYEKNFDSELNINQNQKKPTPKTNFAENSVCENSNQKNVFDLLNTNLETNIEYKKETLKSSESEKSSLESTISIAYVSKIQKIDITVDEDQKGFDYKTEMCTKKKMVGSLNDEKRKSKQSYDSVNWKNNNSIPSKITGTHNESDIKDPKHLHEQKSHRDSPVEKKHTNSKYSSNHATSAKQSNFRDFEKKPHRFNPNLKLNTRKNSKFVQIHSSGILKRDDYRYSCHGTLIEKNVMYSNKPNQKGKSYSRFENSKYSSQQEICYSSQNTGIKSYSEVAKKAIQHDKTKTYPRINSKLYLEFPKLPEMSPDSFHKEQQDTYFKIETLKALDNRYMKSKSIRDNSLPLNKINSKKQSSEEFEQNSESLMIVESDKILPAQIFPTGKENNFDKERDFSIYNSVPDPILSISDYAFETSNIEFNEKNKNYIESNNPTINIKSKDISPSSEPCLYETGESGFEFFYDNQFKKSFLKGETESTDRKSFLDKNSSVHSSKNKPNVFSFKTSFGDQYNMPGLQDYCHLQFQNTDFSQTLKQNEPIFAQDMILQKIPVETEDTGFLDEIWELHAKNQLVSTEKESLNNISNNSPAIHFTHIQDHIFNEKNFSGNFSANTNKIILKEIHSEVCCKDFTDHHENVINETNFDSRPNFGQEIGGMISRNSQLDIEYNVCNTQNHTDYIFETHTHPRCQADSYTQRKFQTELETPFISSNNYEFSTNYHNNEHFNLFDEYTFKDVKFFSESPISYPLSTYDHILGDRIPQTTCEKLSFQSEQYFTSGDDHTLDSEKYNNPRLDSRQISANPYDISKHTSMENNIFSIPKTISPNNVDEMGLWDINIFPNNDVFDHGKSILPQITSAIESSKKENESDIHLSFHQQRFDIESVQNEMKYYTDNYAPLEISHSSIFNTDQGKEMKQMFLQDEYLKTPDQIDNKITKNHCKNKSDFCELGSSANYDLNSSNTFIYDAGCKPIKSPYYCNFVLPQPYEFLKDFDPTKPPPTIFTNE